MGSSPHRPGPCRSLQSIQEALHALFMCSPLSVPSEMLLSPCVIHEVLDEMCSLLHGSVMAASERLEGHKETVADIELRTLTHMLLLLIDQVRICMSVSLLSDQEEERKVMPYELRAALSLPLSPKTSTSTLSPEGDSN